MLINKLTITGADDSVDPIQLINLSKLYPFVEWGILYSVNKEGTNRYPSQKWINILNNYEVNLSAHFCGWHSKSVLEGGKYYLINNLTPNYKRVQLNYSFFNFLYDLESLYKYSESITNRKIILQHNNKNSEPLRKHKPTENINILYDSSGGRGKVISGINQPFINNYTGYSGGLSPENIEHFCDLITKYPNESNVWLDLESGVRTDNVFDIKKVEEVLSIVSKFVHL